MVDSPYFDPEAHELLRRRVRRQAERLMEMPLAEVAALSGADPPRTILTVLDTALRIGEYPTHRRLLSHFAHWLQLSSELHRLDEHFETALGQPSIHPTERVELVEAHVRLLAQLGAFERGWAQLERAARESDDPAFVARIEQRRAQLLDMQERREESEAAYRHALELAEAHGERALCASIRNNLGNWSYRWDHYERALDEYGRALELARACGDPTIEGLALGGLAMTLDRLGRYPEARDHYERALDSHRADHNELGIVRVLLNRGAMELDRGRPDAARAPSLEALEMARRLGDRQREGMALHNLGRISALSGDLVAACDYFERALARRRDVGKPLYIESTRNALVALFATVRDDVGLSPDDRRQLLSRLEPHLTEGA